MKRYFLLVEVLIALAVAGAVLLPFSSATLNTSRALLEKTKQIEQEIVKENLLYEGLKHLVVNKKADSFSTTEGEVRFEIDNKIISIFAKTDKQKEVKRQLFLEIDN